MIMERSPRELVAWSIKLPLQITASKRKRDNVARFRTGPAYGPDQAVHER